MPKRNVMAMVMLVCYVQYINGHIEIQVHFVVQGCIWVTLHLHFLGDTLHITTINLDDLDFHTFQKE